VMDGLWAFGGERETWFAGLHCLQDRLPNNGWGL
jgi:hypothetical protein